MADLRHDLPLIAAREEVRLGIGFGRRSHARSHAVQHHGRHLDQGLRCEAPLDVLQRRIACDIAIAVTIGVDDYFDEIRIVERGGGAREGRIVELSVG